MKKSLIIKSIFLSLILIFTFAIPILANTSPSITRLAGVDRYETASKIAKQGWTQSDYVILAYGENYPDALSSAPLAKKYNAPILLTNFNTLPSTTKQTLIDLQVKNVIIIGGTGVISSSIDTELQSMGINSNRIAGNDKYETSIKVAEQVNPSPSSIFVCTGEDYSDALSVAPIASMKQIPIILVPRDLLPSSVKSFILKSFTLENKISKTYVIGSSDVISDYVFNHFPHPERIVGEDKYARNIAVNQKFNDEFETDSICLATGEGFADALTGTVYSSKISEPIILISTASSVNTKGYYQQRFVGAKNVYVFGGTGIIPDAVIQGLNGTTQIDPHDGSTTNVVSHEKPLTLMDYLKENYSTLETPIGTLHFTFSQSENVYDDEPYDLEIQTDWDSFEFSPFDLEHSTKISDTDKQETIDLLKKLQKNVAKASFKYYPDKKITGGFYSGFYKYPYLKVGYESISFLSWINYNYDLMDASDYESTSITEFQWFDLFDDYNF